MPRLTQALTTRCLSQRQMITTTTVGTTHDRMIQMRAIWFPAKRCLRINAAANASTVWTRAFASTHTPLFFNASRNGSELSRRE